jgi:hypothetical protein
MPVIACRLLFRQGAVAISVLLPSLGFTASREWQRLACDEMFSMYSSARLLQAHSLAGGIDELASVQVGVDAIPLQQLRMCSGFDDAAFLKHDNAIGVLDRG